MRQPAKFTATARNTIIASIRDGEYGQTAAAKAGVSERTVRKWVDRGRAVVELIEQAEEAGTAPEVPAEDLVYADFVVELARAEAEAEGKAVQQVRQAGQAGNWIAAMTFLERRFPARWKKRDETAITGGDGGPVKVQAIENTPARLAEVISVLKSAGISLEGVTQGPVAALEAADGV